MGVCRQDELSIVLGKAIDSQGLSQLDSIVKPGIDNGGKRTPVCSLDER